MATITILKNRDNRNFKLKFFNWLRSKHKLQKFSNSDRAELEKILRSFTSEIEMVKSIEESSDFITNVGLHAIASNLIEEYIKERTDYVIFDNLEVNNEDHVLIVLPD